MDKDQALNIIEQALQVANSKGAFKLEESATILTALNTIKNVFQEIEQSKVATVGKRVGEKEGK